MQDFLKFCAGMSHIYCIMVVYNFPFEMHTLNDVRFSKARRSAFTEKVTVSPFSRV